MPISILMWKMIFIIYLPPVRTKLVPKLKMLQIYWNLAHLIFQTSRSRLKIILIRYLSPVSAQIGLKIKSAQKLLKFGTLNVSNILSSILTSKFIFIKYLPPAWAQKCPKIKSAQNLLKFGTSDNSNMSILISMSKMIFIEYLPSVRPKFVPRLKVLKSYWNLEHLIFQICRSQF